MIKSGKAVKSYKSMFNKRINKMLILSLNISPFFKW